MSTDDNKGNRISSRNAVDSFQIYVEENFRFIRAGLYITGGLIVVYIARKIHMTSVFRSIDDIPTEFIAKQVRLQGKVKNVHENGALDVQHIPVMELRFPFTPRKDRGSLLVNIACIDIGPKGKAWLDDNVLNKTVWCHLLHRSHRDGIPQLYSRIVIPKQFQRNICVNEELLKQGLCKISQLSDIKKLDISTSDNMLKYLDRLVKFEHQAAKKGVGMWTKDSEKSRTRSGLSVVKNIIIGPFHGLKWIYKKLSRKQV